MPSLRRIRRPPLQRLSDLRRAPLRVAVWVAALAAALYLADRRPRQPDLVGLARSVEYELLAPMDGSLLAVNATLYGEVRAGEVIALLDGSELDARLETARSEIERLTARLEAERARHGAWTRAMERSTEDELRRFHIDEEAKRLEVLALRVCLERDRIERDRLSLIHRHSRSLVDQGIGAMADSDNALLQLQALEKTIEENERLLAQTEAAHLATQHRREEFEKRVPPRESDAAVVAPFSRAIEVQRCRLEEMRLQRRRLLVQAPADASVRAIHRHPGELVRAGQPLVTLTDLHPRELLSYVSDEDLPFVPLGSAVELLAATDSSALGRTVVSRIGPDVEEIPRRLRRQPDVVEYGRPVLLPLPEHLELRPGALVRLRLED